METGFDLRGFSDTAWNAMTHSAWMAYENPIFPVFAITPELAEAFLKTDLSLHVCSVKKVFNSALFLLPNILQNPDGYSLEWVFTSHFLKGETVSTLPKDALLGFSNNIAQKIERIKSLPLEVSKFRWVIALVSLWGEYNQHKSLKPKLCI
jgi:hypothetical protein